MRRANKDGGAGRGAQPEAAPLARRREGEHAARTVTAIWEEEPLPGNPYLAAACRCHGYDLLELVQKRGYVEVLYLLFRGELPNPGQARLLEALMIAAINPGPRHPATRAAMNAGVSRSHPGQLLPVALAVLNGNHLGAGEVVAAMRFLLAQAANPPHEVAEKLLRQARPPAAGDWHLAPGFGSRFGGRDPLPGELAAYLGELPGAGPALAWGRGFVAALAATNQGWLAPGVAAAVFADLGLPPRAGAGLFQLLSAPGLLAHGLELADKPLTAMPFLDPDHYLIDDDAKAKRP